MFVKRQSVAQTLAIAPPLRAVFPRNTQFEAMLAELRFIVLPLPLLLLANTITPPQAVGDRLLPST